MDHPGEKQKNYGEFCAKISELSVHAQVFVPQQAHMGSLYDPMSSTSQWLDYLFNDPEELPNVVTALEEILSMYLDVKPSLEAIVDNLIKRSVDRDNVQYIAAQCFNALCQNLKKSVFQEVFICRCNLRYKEYLPLQVYEEGLTNFTLLIAEISLLLKNSSGGHFRALLDAVVDLLNKLLDFSTDSTIRCIQKVLKIAGRTIDKSANDHFTKFFDKVKEKAVADGIPKQHRTILLDIIILESVGWQLDDPYPSTSGSINLSDQLDGIIFKKTNDEDISNIYYGDTIIRTDSEHYLIPNEDAEPEIYEDYENFVAESESGMDANVQYDYEQFLEELEKKRCL